MRIGSGRERFCASRRRSIGGAGDLIALTHFDQLDVHGHGKIKRFLARHARGRAFDGFGITEDLNPRFAQPAIAAQEQSHGAHATKWNVALEPDSAEGSPQVQIAGGGADRQLISQAQGDGGGDGEDNAEDGAEFAFNSSLPEGSQAVDQVKDGHGGEEDDGRPIGGIAHDQIGGAGDTFAGNFELELAIGHTTSHGQLAACALSS